MAANAPLADKIKDAVKTGDQPNIGLDELLAQPSSLPGALRVVEVDIADLPPLSDVYRIAALLPGLPIGQWLPKEDFLSPVFNNGVAQLDYVAFTVDVAAKKIKSIALRLTLNGAKLSAGMVSATVTQLNVVLYPDVLSQTVVGIVGKLTLGSVDFDASLSCPSLAFSAAIPRTGVVHLSDLASAFGIPISGDLGGLLVSALDLSFNVREQTAALVAGARTDDGNPLTIIPDVLGLDAINVDISHAPGTTDITLDATLIVRKTIVLGVQVSGGTGQDWVIGGGIDIPETEAKFKEANFPDDGKVTIGNILRGALDVTLPSEFDFLTGIELVTLEGTVTLGSPRTWSLDVAVDVDWKLADAVFKANTAVQVGSDGTQKTGSVKADLRIGEDDGPGLSLQVDYKCAAAGKTIDFTLPQLGLTTDYTIGTEQLVITFDGQSLGDLIGDVAEIFTGNPYVVLPPPWSDILNEIPLPGIKLTVNLKTKAVSFEWDKNIDFFGNTITGIVIGYDPTKDPGSRISFTVLGTFPLLGGLKNPTWDPTKPGQAPAVPGQGSKLIDIQLVAAGQHVVLAPPTTVEAAVKAIHDIAVAAGGSDPDKLPNFDPTAGWLVGTHMVFKGVLDFQFVFADPVIYGAVIQIADPQPDTPPALQQLKGLYVEILYRKVTSSIGVYEGMLTLPDKIRKIDYGAFLLQLPSISLDIYTNGDFLIDVGFPHNGDFSKSAVINAGQYIGAGGVYYGHLSGSTASALPTVATVPINGVDLPIGTFNTVTEIGIGLRVGIGKSYSEGPLSASVFVVIQAIFEGLFSTYTQFPLPAPYSGVAQPSYPVTTEYFKIVASLGVVGQLQGSIDFAIISASLLVQIELIATVKAESYMAVQVEGEVDVDVELTVRINLGLFSISIHCSFSTTVRFSTQFGSDASVFPWTAPPPPLAAAHRTMLRTAALRTAAPLRLDFQTPPCKAVATTLYVVPQLSRSLADVANPGGEVDWVYTVQFALPVDAPASAPLGTFADFAKFVTAWAVDAAWPHTGSPTTPDEFYSNLSVDPTKTYDPSVDQMVSPIDHLIAALKAIPNNPGGFDDALAHFFAQNQFALATTSKTDADKQFGFFPILPPFVLGSAGGTIIPAIPGVPIQVLRAYAALVATIVLDSVQKAIATKKTLKEAYDALGPAGLSQALGMATRFMLHGTRYSGTSTHPQPLQPVYRAAGQELSVDLDAKAPALAVTVSGPDAGTWGVTIPSGSLTISSADPSPNRSLHTQAEIGSYRTGVTPTGITAGTMPSTVNAPVRFAVKHGADAATTLRGLPGALQAWVGNPAQFSLYDEQNVAVPPTAWSWCSTIDFRVQKVPDPATAGAFLPDVYALVAVRSDGLDRLEKIYQACNGIPNFGCLDIVYGVDANQTTSGDAAPTFVGVDPQKIFLFQSNISTETNPPRVALMMARVLAAPRATPIDPKLTFLGRLLTGGLTNSGGYYLYLKLDSPPPPAMFDTRGMAWLTLAVYGFTDTSGTIKPYLNALRISGQTYAKDAAITLQSPAVQAPQATIATGFVGTQISRPDWSGEDDTLYQRSLDGLFNLIDCEPTAFLSVPPGSNWTVVPGNGQVVGPIKIDGSTGGPHIYRAQFDLLRTIGRAPDTYPNPPTDAADPYQFAGAQLQLAYGWVDFYGNTLPPGFDGTPLAIGLVDPLLGLDDWPGLSYGFVVTDEAGPPQLIVKMTYRPPADETQIDGPTYQQYVKIYHQLKTATVAAEASFVTSDLTIPTNQTSAPDVLRANVLTIIGATAATDLTSLVFPLPSPVSPTLYKYDLLQQLKVTLRLVRPGPVAPGLEKRDDILLKRTVLAPFQDKAAQQVAGGMPATPLGYRKFATDLERTFKDLGIRVMGGDLDVPGGAKFWLLRWQGQGLQVGFKPGGMGFAPTPIATSLQSRPTIDPSLFSDYAFPSDFFITSPLNVSNMDMDSVLSGVLTAIEGFLSPEYAIPAAIALPDQVDASIAQKQSLAQTLASRVIPLSDDTPDPALLAAATTKYQQACLLDLRNFYAVDAAAGLSLTVTTPSTLTAPDLIVYGHMTPLQPSDVVVSAGQSRINATSAVNANGVNTTSAAMALSLSARHKDWKASFQLPGSFWVEALERVEGTIDVTDPDEPVGQSRKYVMGTWLRFITDEGLNLTLDSPPTIPLPLRSYPPAPTLSAQGYSQLDGTKLASVKSWSLDCTYRHQYAGQDTVHITAVLNEPPTLFKAMARRKLDLLDGLALFQAIYPKIRAAFDSDLRLTTGAHALSPATLDAIKSFVLLVRCIAENFTYTPKGGRAVGGVPGGATFELVESFDGDDPAHANWQATLTKTADPTRMCPPPIVVIDQTSAGQPSSGATLYRGVPVQDSHNAAVYNIAQFVNDPGAGKGPAQALRAIDALGNPNRSLHIRPLDIVDWHSGRYYLQIVRNQTMPVKFQYVTALVAAKDRVLPLIDNANADVDLAQLPPIHYTQGGPPANSFGDILARLYCALLTGQRANPDRPPGGMRTEISLSYPLIPNAPASDALPDIRLPVVLQLLAQDFIFYPTPDQAWAMAGPVAAKVTNWLQTNNISASQRPDLYAVAKLDVSVTVFSATSETSLPMIYLDGLYVNLRGLVG